MQPRPAVNALAITALYKLNIELSRRRVGHLTVYADGPHVHNISVNINLKDWKSSSFQYTGSMAPGAPLDSISDYDPQSHAAKIAENCAQGYLLGYQRNVNETYRQLCARAVETPTVSKSMDQMMAENTDLRRRLTELRELLKAE